MSDIIECEHCQAAIQDFNNCVVLSCGCVYCDNECYGLDFGIHLEDDE